MRQTVLVGLVFDYGVGYCRGILRGIKEFAERRPHWALFPIAPNVKAIEAMGRLGPGGVIAWASSTELATSLKRLRAPWVNTCGSIPVPGVPRVGCDDRVIGRYVAEHFLRRGIRQFGFIGNPHNEASKRREASYRATVEREGTTVTTYLDPDPRPFLDYGRGPLSSDPGFCNWLASLPRPVGIYSFYDMWGLQLTETCLRLGLHVPEEVAIVGTDNDDLLCQLARPSLSSVATPSEKIGFEAGALLERLLEGAEPPDAPILIPPLGVVARQSSDILAIEDPDVVAAIRLLHARSHQPTRVDDLLMELPINRRTLERKFHKALGRGVSQEIRRVRMDRARELLIDQSLSIVAVAERAGFSSARHLSVAFREQIGMSPTAYRDQFRGPPRS